MEIGKTLMQHRLNHNLTQLELSMMLNLTRQAISSFERDKRSPDIYILWDLADIYHMTMDELIGRKF